MVAIRSQYRKAKNGQSYTNPRRTTTYLETASGNQHRSSQQSIPSGRLYCTGCGSNQHSSSREDNERSCPAWGKTCTNCRKLNHFASLCRSKSRNSAAVRGLDVDDDNSEEVGALIAHVRFDKDSDTYTTNNDNNIQEIHMTLRPFQCDNDPRSPENIFQ